ncbi:hypothetical protein X760_09670 [Mesorhizobium sp. LSHC422A00]|nr:hypothetical protein X760_09670 [Mesorhizobium sp. LSHC422A00]ESY35133.1 hypothetical protein X748_18355 [Mesorhizobium sp. LNJC386A00]
MSESLSDIVIHGRSKEGSDAAQTRGFMPRRLDAATVQNSAPLRSTANITEWTRGFATELRSCFAHG